jgi:hypothetical protein
VDGSVASSGRWLVSGLARPPLPDQTAAPLFDRNSELTTRTMSADLFAEFLSDPAADQGKPPATSRQQAAQPPPSFGFFDSLNTTPVPADQAQQPTSQQQFQSFTPATNAVTSIDEDDDWGDFEGGSSTIQPKPPSQQDPFAFSTTTTTQPSYSTAPLNAAIHDPFAFDLGRPIQSTENTWQKAPIIKAKRSADPSVLFDAEDDLDDDDDFGDFEGTDTKHDTPAPATSSSAMVDLLGDLNVSQPEPPITTQRIADNATNKRALNTAAKKKSPVSAFVPKQPAKKINSEPPKEDDAWGTFDDWEASIPIKTPANSSSKRAAIPTVVTDRTTTPAPILSPTTDDAQPGELAPTNVPPPGVLLSLFPSLFADAQEKLFKPMAAQTLPMRNKLMAEPGTINYLQGYLMLANVAAHIIAGRKLRWKRDQHLSQGMRIGPASSRATSGMKLTGIDKGENMKEEREASDVVRVWKDQVGRLRHIVSGTNQIKAGTLGAVPDLQETMPVKTLKQSEGGMPARQPCMLCGLKREERVTAADMATDDSFGEWWIDQVNMHRGERADARRNQSHS